MKYLIFGQKNPFCSILQDFRWIFSHLLKIGVPLLLTNPKYPFNTLQHRGIGGRVGAQFTYNINSCKQLFWKRK